MATYTFKPNGRPKPPFIRIPTVLKSLDDAHFDVNI